MAGMVRKSSEKSNFTLACSLLSQYIKEKRNVPDLGVGVRAAPPPPLVKVKSELIWPPPTMSFLPGADDEKREAAGDINIQKKAMDLFPASTEKTVADVREQERAQLTIFYGGKVLVFDEFPAEKAKDLMQIASKSISTVQNLSSLPPSSARAASATDNLNVLPDQESKPVQPDLVAAANGHIQVPPKPTDSNLPIAPRSSLQRFLQKRKHRINSKAPYQVGHAKEEDGKSWLGLAPEVSGPSPGINSDYSS